MVLVDADYFIGLYLSSDPHHKTCLLLAEKIKEDLLITYDVVDEVVTKLSYFGRKDLSLIFLKELRKKSLTIIFPNHKLFIDAQNIFQSQKSTHVSLTDCMNMAIAQEKKIAYFLSFDRIYENNGFKLVK